MQEQALNSPPLVKSLLFLNCFFSFNEFLNKARCACSLSGLRISGRKRDNKHLKLSRKERLQYTPHTVYSTIVMIFFGSFQIQRRKKLLETYDLSFKLDFVQGTLMTEINPCTTVPTYFASLHFQIALTVKVSLAKQSRQA